MTNYEPPKFTYVKAREDLASWTDKPPLETHLYISDHAYTDFDGNPLPWWRRWLWRARDAWWDARETIADRAWGVPAVFGAGAAFGAALMWLS